MRLVIYAVDGKSLDPPLDYAFQQARVVIGRGVGADVRIPHRTVSGQHAIVREEGNAHVVEDCESTNGTYVNGARLVPQRPRKLAEADRLRVGGYELTFHATALVAEPMTVERTAELARRLLRGAGLGAPRLVVLDGRASGTTLSLPAGSEAPLLIGRAESCALVLDDPEISREHLRIERNAEGVWAVNLESKNGVLLHGQTFERRRLRDGDELTVGAIRLLFEDPAEESLQALLEEPDQVWAAPASAPAPAPSSRPPEPSAAAPQPTPSERPQLGKQGGHGGHGEQRAGADADLVIYGLAALILALSGVGLYLLMGAQ